MMRLFIGLTLLLTSFLSALDALKGLHDLAARIGVYRWVPELVLAAIAVALFVHQSRLKKRLLFPRRGFRLLAAGIALYGVGAAAAGGLLVKGAGMLPVEQGTVWARLPEWVARVYPQPVFIAALLLLAMGAFRALSNLVPPAEFQEDF
jgi:hypothetical protein